ncbi:MAG: hypothetical protein JSV58_06075 [Candidatus Bathyarchaeota archaeon]|nr:MAG: hypothetical protein JSV58_06075 [Candidatus Bathyarchaeota archaeon]
MPLESTESLSSSVDVLTKNPGLFVPALAPIALQVFFLILAHTVNPWLTWMGYFIVPFIGFLSICVTVDMTNDIVNNRPMDLKKSVDLVIDRLGSLILAIVISAICFMTIVLIPVALFIIVIAVVEGTDAVDSTEQSLSFVIKNLGEVIIFIIVVIVVQIVLAVLQAGFAFIPVVGAYIGAAISWLATIVFVVMSVNFYLSLRQTQKQLPPPPPPPPPTS